MLTEPSRPGRWRTGDGWNQWPITLVRKDDPEGTQGCVWVWGKKLAKRILRDLNRR